MIFLPRASLPPKLTIVVKKVSDKDYEITTEPKLDPTVFGTFLIRFKQCSRGAGTVKMAAGKIMLSGENPDFNAILQCMNQGSPIPVELKM
ncbi:MAG: hypothetical protein DRJ68_06155 [Thermoprotei archaeon]|nr:MAG: hypothetical protein DRJ68_06155 [Thermoprotei archaeon]